jgi:hypothetical protein
MTTVHNALLHFLRAHHLTTWFGNPSSSELALLQVFPDGIERWSRTGRVATVLQVEVERAHGTAVVEASEKAGRVPSQEQQYG